MHEDEAERFVEDLLNSAWKRHDVVRSDNSEEILNRAGDIREAFFEDK